MADPFSHSRLADPHRLQVLDSSGLMGADGDMDLDRISRLASRMLAVPVCLVSLVGEDCQIFPGAEGLPMPWASLRKTPLSHSLCQHVVIHEAPLVISDAKTHSVVSTNLAVRDLGVAAYLGFPITTSEGATLGSFCVIDTSPREGSEDEISTVREFTAIVANQVEARIARQRDGNLLDVVIHDLKTPLAGVTLVAAVLLERSHELPEKLQPLADALVESGRKAMDLIDSLSRRQPMAGIGLCAAPAQIIKDVVETWKTQARDKNVTVTLDQADDLPEVAAEQWIIERIVENLLGNAIKFSPPGAVVTIATRPEGNWMKLELSDDGPGFTENDRLRLFQRYARLSARPTGGEPSTGLGLSIVKRLVDQCSGRITLHSIPGKGATFEVLLPLVR